MKRREFITLIGGAAGWPMAAGAQQRERMRRIGVLMNLDANDAEGQARNAAFLQGLQQHGWSVGRNVRIDYRWGADDPDGIRKNARELAALEPDVILASGAVTVQPLQQVTRRLPIVFANVADPVGAGFVESLARPGGNATGFTNFEFGMSGKWLELLKQIDPHVARVALLRETDGLGIGQWGAIQAVAPSFGVELTPINPRSVEETERAISAFARIPNGGMIVAASAAAARYRDQIVTLAASRRMPAVYPFRYFTSSGGLISYGPDTIDPYRRAAGYVDRILKGEKPADLPVQQPTKYELVINLKTAKALGLAVPPSLFATADEIIE